MPTYQSPGVYREDVFQKPKQTLPTGVPGFVGFAEPKDGTAYNEPVALHRKDEFGANFTSPAGYLQDAVTGFFDNGGISCYVVAAEAAESIEDKKEKIQTALDALAPLTDLDLVAVPDATFFKEIDECAEAEREQLRTRCLTEAGYIQQKVLDHCFEHGNRFAILDAIGGNLISAATNRKDAIKAQRTALLTEQSEPVSGAMYYPWITLTSGKTIPPCGHVAGIYARTDGKTGVHKAPANEEVRGIIDLEAAVDNGVQDEFNPLGINCLRAFPGRGIRVWGARTVSRDQNWRYVNVRRLVLTLVRWIDSNMTWAAFEPNTPRLWIRIRRELGVHLGKLWKAGALKGESADQAFYVKCDTESNPPEEREAGRAITEIGLAPALASEFIVIRVMHRAGTTELD